MVQNQIQDATFFEGALAYLQDRRKTVDSCGHFAISGVQAGDLFHSVGAGDPQVLSSPRFSCPLLSFPGCIDYWSYLKIFPLPNTLLRCHKIHVPGFCAISVPTRSKCVYRPLIWLTWFSSVVCSDAMARGMDIQDVEVSLSLSLSLSVLSSLHRTTVAHVPGVCFCFCFCFFFAPGSRGRAQRARDRRERRVLS